MRPRTTLCARGGDATDSKAPVPIVLLSGFLGTGKTTLLKHWLENAEGRIGVVVNDVASVNIDAKLVKTQKKGELSQVDTIQLENGCACCSLGDELLVTIFDLLQLANDGGRPFSQIVVELSGVAEPQRVREIFKDADLNGVEFVKNVKLSKVVTLMDSSTFCNDYMAYSQLIDRPDLFEEGAEDLAECKVVELLMEQVEAADVIVLNKTDLADGDKLDATKAVVETLNKGATICETSFGKVPLSTVLAEAPKVEAQSESGHGHEEHGHECSHGHEEHGHAEAHSHGGSCSEPSCSDPTCTDPSHNHSDARADSCGDPTCSDPTCSDPSHAHSHDGGHSHDSDCGDPNCNDPSHGHSHSHSHATAETTAAERFGIVNFTYTANRPFCNERLNKALQAWPVPKKECLGEMLEENNTDGDKSHAMSRVIRSKGFCWIDEYPSSRMYWSHAGKNMVLQFEGLWWGAMNEDQIRMMDQLNEGEYDRVRKEEWSEDFADRRQELVFIGQRLDEAGIREILDDCLLKDDELKNYLLKQEEDAGDLAREWMKGMMVEE